MNILVLLITKENQKKTNEEESGTIDGMKDGGPRLAQQELQPYFDAINFDTDEKEKIHSDPTIDEFELHREVTGSHRDRQNLIDLLYNGECISLRHKQHIEQQPTQQLQNREMLQLIKNGSIETFKVVLEYFRVTNQDDVFDMLNRKYLSEGIVISIYEILIDQDMNQPDSWHVCNDMSLTFEQLLRCKNDLVF